MNVTRHSIEASALTAARNITGIVYGRFHGRPQYPTASAVQRPHNRSISWKPCPPTASTLPLHNDGDFGTPRRAALRQSTLSSRAMEATRDACARADAPNAGAACYPYDRFDGYSKDSYRLTAPLCCVCRRLDAFPSIARLLRPRLRLRRHVRVSGGSWLPSSRDNSLLWPCNAPPNEQKLTILFRNHLLPQFRDIPSKFSAIVRQT